MKVQIGKNGVTDGVLEHIKNAAKTHDQVTVNFLQSFTASNDVDEAAETIQAYLDPIYDVTTETRGHTVNLLFED